MNVRWSWEMTSNTWSEMPYGNAIWNQTQHKPMHWLYWNLIAYQFRAMMVSVYPKRTTNKSINAKSWCAREFLNRVQIEIILWNELLSYHSGCFKLHSPSNLCVINWLLLLFSLSRSLRFPVLLPYLPISILPVTLRLSIFFGKKQQESVPSKLTSSRPWVPAFVCPLLQEYFRELPFCTCHFTSSNIMGLCLPVLPEANHSRGQTHIVKVLITKLLMTWKIIRNDSIY